MDLKKSEEYIATHRFETIKHLCHYLSTDTLLFWSEETELKDCQQKTWQPIFDMLKSTFNLDLKKTISLMPADNKESEQIFEKLLNMLSDKELTACFLAASEMKSVLLGLLLAKQKITVSEAFAAAFLEELYQNLFWGKDVAAVNAQNQSKKELEKIAEYLN